MAEVNFYIDPDVIGGLGNGTSWENAYSSRNAFIAAEAADLVSAMNNYVVYCRSSSGTADISTTITGFILNTTYNLKFINYDYPEKWDDTKYRIIGNNANVYIINQSNVIEEGLQVEITGMTANYQQALYVTNLTSGAPTELKNCITKGANDATYRERVFSGNVTAGRILKISNCVSFNANTTNASVVNNSAYFTGGGTVYFYNNTIFGGYNNIALPSGTVCESINTIFVNAGDAVCPVAFAATSNYNSSDKSTTTGGANDRINQSFSFTDSVNGDFLLKSDDTGALDYGVDLSVNPNIAVTTDLRNLSRSIPYDIGAYEYIPPSDTLYIKGNNRQIGNSCKNILIGNLTKKNSIGNVTSNTLIGNQSNKKLVGDNISQ